MVYICNAVYKAVTSKKFEKFLNHLVIVGTSQKSISGRLIEIDEDIGYLTLEHKDGRHTLINAAGIEFLTEPGAPIRDREQPGRGVV